MATKTKADRSFDEKLGHLLGAARRPAPYPMSPEAPAEAVEAQRLKESLLPSLPLDTAAVEALFGQYGVYLELIGMDEPVGSELAFQYPAPLEVPAEDEQELADA